ncbi:hypothetical protein ACHWQZ_G016352 [Mnemiopsis leidyi]
METSEELELSRVDEDTLDLDVTDDILKLLLLLMSLVFFDTVDVDIEVERDDSKLDPNEVVTVDDNRGLVANKSEEDDTDNLVEEEEDKSVIPIDGSVEELKDIELPVKGSTMPELAVEDVVKDDLSLLLLFLAYDSCDCDDKVGSVDVSVKSVFLVKLADGESVTYDVEKELLKVLVTVVGVTVGMDDRTDVREVPVVLSLSCPLPPSPPEVNNDDELTVTGVVEGIDGINDKLDVTTDELFAVSFEDDTELLFLTEDAVSSVQVDVDDLPVVNVEEDPTVSVDSTTDDKLLIDVLAVKLIDGDKVR